MSRNRFPVVLAVAAVAMAGIAFATPANAAIIIASQVEGFLGSDKTKVATAHNGTTEVSYDATGIDKLVVAIGTESGFNNQKVNTIGVTFNGVPLTLAVQENFAPPGSSPFTNDGGIAAILYLDHPFQGAANFSVSATTTGGGLNGGHVSIIGLAGTEDGVGNIGANWTSQGSAGNVSTSLTTSANDSLVIGMVENSGSNNNSGTPNVVSPLTLSNNGYWGNNWGGAASGFQYVASSGTNVTPTFSTNAGGSIHVIAAEFLAAPPPPGPVIYEPFDYTAPGNLNGQNGGTGFSGPWQGVKGNPTIQPGSLDWGNLGTTGNRAAGSAWNTVYRPLSSDLADRGLLDDGATLWFSYVMDITGQNTTNVDFNVALVTDPFVSNVFGERQNLQNDGEGIGGSYYRTNVRGAYWQDDGDGDGYGEQHQANSTLTLNNSDNARAFIVGKIDWGDTAETLTLYAPDEGGNLGSPILVMTTPNLDQTQFNYLAIQVKDRPSVDEIRFGATMLDVSFIPEPSSLALAALGLLGMAFYSRRRKR